MKYAAVMGIKKDLNLVGNDFSNTATWFFIAYLIAEVPNGEFSLPLQAWFLQGHILNRNRSILLTKSTTCKMARSKCCSLGSRGRRFRRCTELPRIIGRSYFLGYFRSDSWPISDAH